MLLGRCGICRKKVKYLSISDGLSSTLKSYGFPYNLVDFETLNYKKYSCPNCGSSDRDRLYWLYISKYINSKKSMLKMVDFAPSASLEKCIRSKVNIEYRSADLLIKEVDDKVDITDMKDYEDNSFDFFICSHILEHVVDDEMALRELFRIIKPGGSGILMVPIINKKDVYDEDINEKRVSERWRRFAQDDHVRLYDRQVFINRVKKAGFVIDVYGSLRLGFMEFVKNGISLKSKLYIVRK